MAKRVTQQKLQIEEKPSTNYMRVTQMKLHVEEISTLNFMRVSMIKLMVEYMTPPPRVGGPAVQTMDS